MVGAQTRQALRVLWWRFADRVEDVTRRVTRKPRTVPSSSLPELSQAELDVLAGVHDSVFSSAFETWGDAYADAVAFTLESGGRVRVWKLPYPRCWAWRTVDADLTVE